MAAFLLGCSADAFTATTDAGPTTTDAAADGAARDAAPTDTVDATPDASGPCDPKAPFGTPELVPGVSPVVGSTFLDRTGDRLYVSAAGDLVEQVLVSGSFGLATPLATVNAPNGTDVHATVASDGKLLAFVSDRTGQRKLYLATRAAASLPFGIPSAAGALAAINATSAAVLDPHLSQDGTVLYFTTFDPDAGQYILSVASRSDTSQPFGGVKSLFVDARSAVLSPDGLVLYYASVAGRERIFVTTRAQVGAPFPPGAIVPELDVSEAAVLNQMPMSLSPDGCTLYFVSTRGGKAYGAYRATRGK
jgi:Tol biopolymer transport system component